MPAVSTPASSASAGSNTSGSNRSDNAYRMSTTSPMARLSTSRARRGDRYGNRPSSTNRRARASPTKTGAITRCISSTRLSVRNWVWIRPPPSTIRRRMPRRSRSRETQPIRTGSPASTTLARSPSRRRARCTAVDRQYTSLSSPVRKKSASAVSRAAAVTVTFTGVAAAPPAVRRATRPVSRTSSRGLSARIVPAPTRIASHRARTASTRSRSAVLDRVSRPPEALEMYPSSDMQQLSTVYGRPSRALSPNESPSATPSLMAPYPRRGDQAHHVPKATGGANRAQRACDGFRRHLPPQK